jgi:hypothetical protein
MASSPVVSFAGWLPCLIALGAIGVVVVVLLIYLRRRNPIQEEPICGQCGYNVTGLPSSFCPECGSDLRAVGIIAAGSRKPLPPLVKGILWSLFLPAPATIISIAIIVIVPLEARSSHTYMVKPASQAYTQIAVESEALGRFKEKLRPNKITLQLLPNLATVNQARQTELTIDPVSLAYQYQRPNGEVVKATQGFDAHVILDWMEACGVDGNKPAARQEAKELFNQVEALGTGEVSMAPTPAFTSTATSGSYSSGPPFWLTLTLLITWPIVWLTGLWHFTRKRRPLPSQMAELPEKPVESA